MKRTLSFLIFLFTFLSMATSTTQAFHWEIGIAVQSQATKILYVYSYNAAARAYILEGSGSCDGSFGTKPFGLVEKAINAALDLDTDTDNTIGKSLNQNVTYYLVIDNWWMSISGSTRDIWFSYTDVGGFEYGGQNGIYSYSIGSQNWNTKTVTLANNFGSDHSSCSGIINMNSATITTYGDTGVSLYPSTSSFPHTVYGQDGQIANYHRRKWRNWSDTDPNISKTLSQATDYNFTAIYARQVDATISLNPSGSTIKMNGNVITGNQYMCDDLPYTFIAENQVSSTRISYTFDHWIHDGVTVTNNVITINNPSSGHSLAAYFVGTALPDTMHIHFTSTNGNPISLGWTEHPDNGVTQYQVWRYKEGWSPSSIALLNRGTTSYIDYDYIQNPNGDVKLFYTVKAYYSPSGTWNDPGYYLNRGDLAPSIVDNNNNRLIASAKELPSEYSIANYPNPFNPTTTINYQLPEDGFVTLKVFDVLGKEMATLVNESKTAGYYNVTFDASRLTSGVYIYRIDANGFTQSKKMLLMK